MNRTDIMQSSRQRNQNGYKHSEVGIIPVDWEVVRLDELGVWKGGMTPSMQNPSYWLDGNIPWISSGDVKSVLLKETGFSVTAFAIKQKTTTLLPAESIVVVTRSGILRKYLPVAMNVIPMAINQDIKALIPTKKFCSPYLLHALTWNGDRILSRCMKAGTTVESIEFRWLKAFTIPLPTLAEQHAIAEVLGDADALIESLEQLIAKKRAVKQGVMQELLTGKTRLPGFNGLEWKKSEIGDIPSDWNVQEIGQIARVKTGPFGSSLHERDYVDDGTPIITVEHLGERGIVHSNIPMVSSADRRRLSSYSLEEGDIVFSRVGSVDRNARVSTEESGWLFSGRLLRLHVSPGNVDTRYLSYHFHSEPFKQRVRTVAVGQTMASLNTQILNSVLVVLPSLPEQTAIAAILSDMDEEIAALEAKLTKTRQVKQGMMHELLTGRIRLV